MSADLSTAKWFKSSQSAGGGECVEVAFLDSDMIGVRDSKNPAGPALIFTPTEWATFTASIAAGEFGRS
ncbi:DUF397 domain-containing protein [Nocardia sp. NPDC046473]|uniref:DUF397 domain-containing protein n=1 Tax=Nocardia sp. NPDC046473 TaxID=3155733 RepID=UPI0033DF9D4A